MKHYVLLRGKVAAENVSVPDDADIKEMYHESIKLIAVNEPKTIGWVYDEDTNTFAPPQPVQLSKDMLLAYAADRRYQIETQGMTLNGQEISTDRTTQAMLSAAYNMAKDNPNFTTMWKGADGNFTLLDANSIIAIAQAVGARVAACFAAEAAVVAKIKSGDYTTEAHVDNALIV